MDMITYLNTLLWNKHLNINMIIYLFFWKGKSEIYINQIISSAQGVPKRLQKITQYQEYMTTRKLINAQTNMIIYYLNTLLLYEISF
jgi:hypothetical protein